MAQEMWHQCHKIIPVLLPELCLVSSLQTRTKTIIVALPKMTKIKEVIAAWFSRHMGVLLQKRVASKEISTKLQEWARRCLNPKWGALWNLLTTELDSDRSSDKFRHRNLALKVNEFFHHRRWADIQLEDHFIWTIETPLFLIVTKSHLFASLCFPCLILQWCRKVPNRLSTSFKVHIVSLSQKESNSKGASEISNRYYYKMSKFIFDYESFVLYL